MLIAAYEKYNNKMKMYCRLFQSREILEKFPEYTNI